VMKKIFIKRCLAGAAILMSLNTYGQDAVTEVKDIKAAENKFEKSDFIRVDEDDKTSRLQTSVTTYEKDGVKVDLIGAVHIADKEYFADLNKIFTKYEVLLFEMVGGEQMQKGKSINQVKDKDAQFSFLEGMHRTLQDKLELEGQKEHIDYSKENFVHADLSMKEFQKLQKEKKESIFSFAMKSAQSQIEGKQAKQPSTIKLLKALVTGDANLLKLSIVHTLGQGDDQIAALAGASVIIDDRNEKCLQVMDEQIAAGKKNIGIFYGAAHFPDMEERMLKSGFKKEGQTWMTAWDMEKR
jgi:hypothetical protein